MKFFACFKKMNKLGAAMVEYAVLLAFVAAVGSSFTDGFNPAYNNIIKSVSSVLGLAANGSETKTTQQRIYELFTGLNGKAHGGDPSKSLAKDIVSSMHYIEDLAKIDTAYAVDSYDITNRAQNAGLAIDGTKNYKLITIANQSGIPPTKGTENDPSTHFSATQYLFCEDGKNIYLAATRELDSVFIKAEKGHGTFSDKFGEYNRKNDFSQASYKVVDEKNNTIKWLNHTDLSIGFVKYNP